MNWAIYLSLILVFVDMFLLLRRITKIEGKIEMALIAIAEHEKKLTEAGGDDDGA